MISKRSVQTMQTVGTLQVSSIPIVKSVVKFIDKYLPGFPAYLMEGTPLFTTEKLLNQQLVLYFNECSITECRNLKTPNLILFIFIKDDELPGSNSKPDIGIFLAGDKNRYSIFQIECKRLPTPKGTNRSAEEYVKGMKSDGGIERFKLATHGGHLRYSAIIGYIQDNNSCLYWHTTINGWINFCIQNPCLNLTWSTDDELKKSNGVAGNVAKCRAKHSRISNSQPITLYHYFLKM